MQRKLETKKGEKGKPKKDWERKGGIDRVKEGEKGMRGGERGMKEEV